MNQTLQNYSSIKMPKCQSLGLSGHLYTNWTIWKVLFFLLMVFVCSNFYLLNLHLFILLIIKYS